VGDVGWNTTEELDLVSPGRNYGWPCYEAGAGTSYGAQTPGYKDLSQCSGPGGIYSLEGTALAATPPDYDFPHNGSSQSVIGGPVYPGGGYPSQYDGKIFFGNFSTGTISTYDPGSGTAASFASGIKLVDLELAPDGNLAYVDIVAGTVGEIVPPAAPPATVTASTGVEPPPVDLSGFLSSAPIGSLSTPTGGRCFTAKRSRHRRARKGTVRIRKAAVRPCASKIKKPRARRHRRA